jgi:hypothetical protein
LANNLTPYEEKITSEDKALARKLVAEAKGMFKVRAIMKGARDSYERMTTGYNLCEYLRYHPEGRQEPPQVVSYILEVKRDIHYQSLDSKVKFTIPKGLLFEVPMQKYNKRWYTHWAYLFTPQQAREFDTNQPLPSWQRLQYQCCSPTASRDVVGTSPFALIHRVFSNTMVMVGDRAGAGEWNRRLMEDWGVQLKGVTDEEKPVAYHRGRYGY